MKKFTLVLLITLFTIPGIAAAKNHGPDGPGISGIHEKGPADAAYWEHEGVVKALSLTDEEIGELKKLSDSHQAVIRELREQIMDEREALRAVMESEDYSASSAQKHFDKAEKLQSQMMQERFDFRLEQRELLGQKRYIKLMEMNRRAWEKRQDRRGADM